MRLATCWGQRFPILLVSLVCPLSLYAEVPDGWHISNEASADFEVGVTKGTNDSSVGYVRSCCRNPVAHELAHRYASKGRLKQLRLACYWSVPEKWSQYRTAKLQTVQR